MELKAQVGPDQTVTTTPARRPWGHIKPSRWGQTNLSQTTGLALLGSGLFGTTAAAVLLVEEVALLANPFHVPSCTLNAVVNCGAVMTSAQAEVFGIPNPIIGLATLPVVAAVGASVLAGARMRTWFWWALAAGCVLGWTFVHWLIVKSIFNIGAVCPYCIVVWGCVAVSSIASLSVLSRANRAPKLFSSCAVPIVVSWSGAVSILVAGAMANFWGA